MTYLPANVMDRWFHLYLILDLYSRNFNFNFSRSWPASVPLC